MPAGSGGQGSRFRVEAGGAAVFQHAGAVPTCKRPVVRWILAGQGREDRCHSCSPLSGSWWTPELINLGSQKLLVLPKQHPAHRSDIRPGREVPERSAGPPSMEDVQHLAAQCWSWLWLVWRRPSSSSRACEGASCVGYMSCPQASAAGRWCAQALLALHKEISRSSRSQRSERLHSCRCRHCATHTLEMADCRGSSMFTRTCACSTTMPCVFSA